jgi:enediyne polyketide synthase
METVTTRSAATWRDLLGEDRYRAARILADDRSESFDTAATRLWGAIECLRKAELQHGTPVTLASGADDEIVLLGAGRAAIASLVAEIDGAPQPVVITLLRRGDDAGI